MAPTSKNNKQAAPKKKNLGINSSDQKENRPKTPKIIKQNLNDSISMSKQLMKKKSDRITNRHKQKIKKTNRFLPKGKPMPSLTDLEAMFENSDDDINDHKSTESKDHQALACDASSSFYNTAKLLIPEVNITDCLLSPSTHNNIKQGSANGYNDVKITPPPRNRQSNEFHDLSVIDFSPGQKEIISSDLFLSDNEQNETCHKKIKSLIPSLEPKETVEDVVPDDGNVSDNSADSNKTIVYNLPRPKLQNESISQAFCPLPSTSKDDKTFIKNDELFLESLKEINNNLPKEQSLQLQTPENDTATIVIDDEIMQEPPIDITTVIENEIQVIDSVDENTHSKVSERIGIQNICEDDDCIIVETCTDATNMTINRPDIIDVEYNYIKTESDIYYSTTHNVNDEVIDVDALIAQNQLILEKYRKTNCETLDGPNRVVDVDISDIIEDRCNENVKTRIQEQPSVEHDVISLDMQEHPNNQHDLNHDNISQNPINNSHIQSAINTEFQAIDVSYNTNVSLNARPEYEYLNVPIPHNPNRPLITQHQVADFFNRFYNPYDNTYRNSSSDQLLGASERTPPIVMKNIVNERLRRRSEYEASWKRSRETFSARRPQRSSESQKKESSKGKKAHINSGEALSPVDEGDSDSKSSGSLGDCPICMEKLSGNVIASTICGHVFCMSCLEKAIKNIKRCPTCRKALKSNGYHKIFL